MIRPLRKTLYIEVLKEQDPKKGGIVLTKDNTTYFDKIKVLAVGSEVKDIKKGDICYVHKVFEPLEIGSNLGFITEDRVFAIEEQRSDS